MGYKETSLPIVRPPSAR